MKTLAKKYSNIDWSKKDAQIARERGCSRQAVHLLRLKYAPNTKKAKLDHDLIDWGKNNEELAKTHGYSLTYIAFLRTKHSPGQKRASK
jgi:hypothetical protein